MNNYYNHLILFFKRMLLAISLMTLSRIIFLLFNYSVFNDLSIIQQIKHLFYGVYFDLSTVFMFNILFIILSIFFYRFSEKDIYNKIIKFLFVFINACLLAFNTIDVKFFEFEGKRLTGDFFSKEWLGSDFVVLLPEFIKSYWYMFIVFLLFLFLLIKGYPKEKENKTLYIDIKTRIKQLIIGLILLGSSFIIARGGLTGRPIEIIAAARYTTPKYIPLVLNSPFTIIKTINKKALSVVNYYGKNELDSIYTPVHQYKSTKDIKKTNIVIIILESFGREYSGFLNGNKGYTPNLDSIMKKGLVFKNAYANGRRSIEALPSIFSSLPQLMDRPFVNTQFVANKIEGLGNILKSEGYVNSFFHGGDNGTMGFDDFTKLVGIDSYFGRQKYKNENDYDGNWGIYDEPYLQYFVRNITTMKEPFFTSVFTLSSHHPYKIPKEHINQFPKGDLVNLESIGYADYALGEFFKMASTKKWFKNTLFVLTADHTAQAKKEYYKTPVGRYAIPIIFYAPGDTLVRGVSDLVCQQADIMPSVLDYINYNKPFVAFGNSVFSEYKNRFAISYIMGVYQIINSKLAIDFDGDKIIKTTLFNNIECKDSLINDTERLLKGIIQQYNYRMNNNKLTIN